MKTVSLGLNKKVLTYNLSEPLCEATSSQVEINVADGNLSIDRLTGGEQLLASGTLEYMEDRLPTRSVDIVNGRATLTLKAKSTGRVWFRFPWSACNGATEWYIQLNPDVQSDVAARSGGGNVKLNLAGMAVTHVSAETGGGNVNVVLPDNAADLSVDARTGGGNVTVEIGDGIKGSNNVSAHSGAGNVIVSVPCSIAARIHASSGWGKQIIDPRFNMLDSSTYQSPDYDGAGDKVDIDIQSGAGNVSVNIK